jgi:hypothetical protein
MAYQAGRQAQTMQQLYMVTLQSTWLEVAVSIMHVVMLLLSCLGGMASSRTRLVTGHASCK